MQSQELSRKPLFNLSKVLQETGIKADTLRAWERRYQLPAPARTDGGHRLFSPYDVETIKWLLARQEEGMRISQAVDYWRELIAAGTDPLAAQVQQSAGKAPSPAIEISLQPIESLTRLWIDHSLVFDEEKAGQVLDVAFAQFPWEVVYTNLIYKGLGEIGERWYSGKITVQQEHFASELVVRKLGALTAAAPPPYHPQKVLIGCPPGEFHTIAPLMINTLLRYRGWDVTYLGANLPDHQLQDALEVIRPALVIMTAARLSTAAALLETSQLLQDRDIPLAYGGNAFSDIPGLIESIPGTYLGSDLGQAVARIETILCDPEAPFLHSSRPNPYLDLRNEFQEKLPFLENQVLLATTAANSTDFPPSVLDDANKFLFQDVLAALTLGDLDHLQPNIDWVKGLVNSRNYGLDEFKGYIQKFLEVTEDGLSEVARPLIDWLKAYLNKAR